jgi:galactokinase
LVALGRHRSDVYGARLTGGGFGGAVVYLVHAGAAATAAPAIANAYAAMTGRTATVLVPRAH